MIYCSHICFLRVSFILLNSNTNFIRLYKPKVLYGGHREALTTIRVVFTTNNEEMYSRTLSRKSGHNYNPKLIVVAVTNSRSYHCQYSRIQLKTWLPFIHKVSYARSRININRKSGSLHSLVFVQSASIV